MAHDCGFAAVPAKPEAPSNGDTDDDRSNRSETDHTVPLAAGGSYRVMPA